MPPDRFIPGSPQDWLARAKGDLAIARAPLPEGAFLEDLCFHAQQAAEKAIKAVYVHNRQSFRYTHDLDVLLDGLNRQGVMIPSEIENAAVLTGFASETRYPGIDEPVDFDEYHEAVQQAETVVAWAEREIA